MACLLNQIQACLKPPKVWRFIGFASAVIGLLCYALSSSFNSLFGKWNLWKTLLYCVFSFIICTAALFAKVRQHSSSLRFKAHVPFLVLTITTFHSSFFDKHLDGKPDAYDLVSCAAFAVMSLSLSRQTRCGFGVDLLYFFLGALTVQLTKMEWSLGIVGVGFSYSLIILRSWVDAPEANGYSVLQPQPQVDIQVASLQLLASIDALKEMNPTLLRLVCNYKYQNVGKFFLPDRNLFINALPSEIIKNLNQAMKLAVAAGFQEEFCHLYSSCRKEFLRQCLSALNLQDFFADEYSNVGTATERLQSWIRASEIAVKIVFLNERRLCDRVFFALPSSVGDLSFVQICKEPAVRLLNFPKAFEVEPVICWEVVEVLRASANIVPELVSLFPDQETVSLSNEAITTSERLSEAIRNTFKDTENLTRCDTRVPDVPGGIYPITNNIMDGISRFMEATQAWEEYPMVSDGGGTSPSFHVEIAWIMEQLESYLESMSKNYTEPALCYVSMMNNVMYMKQKIISWQIQGRRKGFLIYPFFSNDEIQKLTSKVQQNLEDYRRISWNEILGLLKLDNEEESVAPGVAAESMKEKLELFNIQFEQICTIQSEWFASDDIRKDIIKSLENMLLPAYGNFIRRFQDILCNRAYEYIQFGIFDIKARLNGTFLGGKRVISSQKWRKRLLKLV